MTLREHGSAAHSMPADEVAYSIGCMHVACHFLQANNENVFEAGKVTFVSRAQRLSESTGLSTRRN